MCLMCRLWFPHIATVTYELSLTYSQTLTDTQGLIACSISPLAFRVWATDSKVYSK